MTLSQTSHSQRVHPSVFPSASSNLKGTGFKRELLLRLEAVRNQIEAVRFATEVAYILPRHVGVMDYEHEEQRRGQLHLLTHMAEFPARLLDDLKDWLDKIDKK
ncbi:hypothetical protein HDU88_007966 [Geranomyces variabilis]|nr:hypothetical protein HDU88_007966 [Geranomyces variabilis]